MSIFEISCPSKTFLLGEYGVLDGGEAVILNTTPRFTGYIRPQFEKFSFNEKSPAGQWIKKNIKDFKQISLHWKDSSYAGGLGFSSAQFNVLYAYSCFLKNISIHEVDVQDLWKAYCSMEFEGCPPSGADVVSQWVGGICVFKPNPFHVTSLNSFFSDLGFFILRTGESLATHEHLKDFKCPNVFNLKKWARKGVQALKSQSKDDFLESINNYRKSLQDLKLVQSQTQDILNQLKSIQQIQAFKGCGAMGAETVIVFFDKKDKHLVRKNVSHLKIVSDETGLTGGIDFSEVAHSQGVDL